MRNNVVFLSLEEKEIDLKKNTYNYAVLDRRGKGCFIDS